MNPKPPIKPALLSTINLPNSSAKYPLIISDIISPVKVTIESVIISPPKCSRFRINP